jgi:DNA-binding CsgD family transcriptional regulator
MIAGISSLQVFDTEDFPGMVDTVDNVPTSMSTTKWNRSITLGKYDHRILCMLSHGLRFQKKSARALGLSHRTVENYIDKLKYKIRAATVSHLVATAIRKQLIAK